jgi:hypothetical protein
MSRVDPDARRRDVGGDNVTIVRSIDEAFGRGDVDAVVDAMTENVEWDESPGMPYGGVHLGRGEFVTIVFGAILADEDASTAEPRRQWGRFVHIRTVDHGKVTRYQQLADTKRFCDTVGT